VKESTRELIFLVATDFDEDVFPLFGWSPIIHRGDWVVDRVPYKPEELIEHINRIAADVLVVEVEEVPGRVFMSCPGLQVVASLRANPVNVDLESAERSGVVVLYAPGRNAQAVAEFTLGLILDLMRSLTVSNIDLQRGRWGEGEQDPYLRFRGRELSGKSVGLLGFGAIGQAVARLLSGFSVDVLACDPYQPGTVFESLGVRAVDFSTLFRESDILSIHLALNEETRGMIGEDELRKMKPGAFLINTARAAIVDRDALQRALTEGWIAGAGLDVHYVEPPEDGDLLLGLPNVLATPHIGGATWEVITKGSEMVIADIDRMLEGQSPKHAAVYPKARRFRIGNKDR
jgi:D-3-phosphoglycerate dehydrogenase